MLRRNDTRFNLFPEAFSLNLIRAREKSGIPTQAYSLIENVIGVCGFSDAQTVRESLSTMFSPDFREERNPELSCSSSIHQKTGQKSNF